MVDKLPQVLQAVTGSVQRRPRYGITLMYNQNKMVAARAIVGWNAFGQRSYRVAMRRQTFRRPTVNSIRFRRL
jgi:hypothetical protein